MTGPSCSVARPGLPWRRKVAFYGNLANSECQPARRSRCLARRAATGVGTSTTSSRLQRSTCASSPSLLIFSIVVSVTGGGGAFGHLGAINLGRWPAIRIGSSERAPFGVSRRRRINRSIRRSVTVEVHGATGDKQSSHYSKTAHINLYSQELRCHPIADRAQVQNSFSHVFLDCQSASRMVGDSARRAQFSQKITHSARHGRNDRRE